MSQERLIKYESAELSLNNDNVILKAKLAGETDSGFSEYDDITDYEEAYRIVKEIQQRLNVWQKAMSIMVNVSCKSIRGSLWQLKYPHMEYTPMNTREEQQMRLEHLEESVGIFPGADAMRLLRTVQDEGIRYTNMLQALFDVYGPNGPSRKEESNDGEKTESES